MSAHQRKLLEDSSAHVFPPVMLRVLRDYVTLKGGCLAGVTDDLLVSLLTTVFWAGLETYEGQHNTIGVVLVGTSTADFIFPEGAESSEAPLYQWKVLRFDSPRPFDVRELVKLAVAGVARRIYTAVGILPDASLGIVGLVREGFDIDPDPFVKIVASRPGFLSIRSGSDLVLAYERGTMLTGGEEVVFSAGPVHRALEAIAHSAGLDRDVVPDYVRAVSSLVGEMTAHGHGGILVISTDEQPDVAHSATYKMARDSSLAALLRLSRRVGRVRKSHQPQRAAPGDVEFAVVLRNAFMTEMERVTEELGALTAIDGALVLNRDLALLAFGVVLPVGHAALAEAMDTEGLRARLINLGSRGTRHRAAAAYAADHPGSVVFVASEDGQVSCMLRQATSAHTLVWRLGPPGARPAIRK